MCAEQLNKIVGGQVMLAELRQPLHEYYVAVLNDRASQGVVLVASNQGGKKSRQRTRTPSSLLPHGKFFLYKSLIPSPFLTHLQTQFDMPCVLPPHLLHPAQPSGVGLFRTGPTHRAISRFPACDSGCEPLGPVTPSHPIPTPRSIIIQSLVERKCKL